MGVLSGLKPKKVFYYFEEISKIPHGSYNTKQLKEYCVNFAKDRNLKYYEDDFQNVIIYKDATPGYENVPTMIIQGHLDMVCEKELDCDIDFTKDGLDLRVDGDFIYAHKTTLGGDDGVAVAFGLAILDDKELKHPALEIIFTSEEEVGLEGATNLDMNQVRGKYFINIDSEEEGIITCGCAGGLRADCTLSVLTDTAKKDKLRISLTNFQGGHSGVEIHKWRINPNILMGRILFDLEKDFEYEICHLSGGLKDNAIPRESFAEFFVEAEDKAAILEWFAKEKEMLIKEMDSTEPNMTLEIEDLGVQESTFISPMDQEKILFFLNQTKNGVIAMSADIEGLVETSLNLGILKLEGSQFSASFALRSSKNSAKWALNDQLEYLIEFLGGSYSTRGLYPAWEYAKISPLRDLSVKVYEENFGKTPEIQAIHAGLECGLFKDKRPEMDCISIGPDLFDVHTPKERLSISSTQKCYEFLCKILENSKDYL